MLRDTWPLVSFHLFSTSFFLILLLSSAAQSVGSYSFLCHLLISSAHNMLGSDMLLRVSPFIPVGYLIFQSLIFEDSTQFGLVSAFFLTPITAGFSAVATSSVAEKYKKGVLKGHSRNGEVAVMLFSSSSLFSHCPSNLFFKHSLSVQERSPHFYPQEKKKKNNNKNQLPASCELFQVSLAQSVVWVEPFCHWVSPGRFLCETITPATTRVATSSCSFTAWRLSALQGSYILFFSLFSGLLKT